MLSSQSTGVPARLPAGRPGGRSIGALRAARVGSVLAAALFAAAVLAAPSGAKVVNDSLIHTKFGIVPAIAGSGAKPAATACTTDCTALTYHSGPVQHAEKDYLIFWAPSGHPVPSLYRTGLTTWLKEVAAKDYTKGNPFSVGQQYYDLGGPAGAKRFVPYGISYGGAFVDTTSYPASGCSDTDANGTPMPICLTKAQLGSEVAAFVSAHGLATGMGTQYYVFTPAGVGSCFDGTSTTCSYTGYCGWHAFQGPSGTPTLFADMPWASNVNGCDVNLAFGAGYPNGDAIDPVVGVLSHEMNESMTDPELNAWFDTSGNENGDKCAYTYGPGGFGSLSGLANNGAGYWNVAFGSDQYLMQLEFDNHKLDCSIKSTFSQPTATVSPAGATHGVSATFTAAVTDAYGLAYIVWDFGDGTPSVTTTGNSAGHTYATAGTRTLTAIVTDAQGNERKVTTAITVS